MTNDELEIKRERICAQIRSTTNEIDSLGDAECDDEELFYVTLQLLARVMMQDECVQLARREYANVSDAIAAVSDALMQTLRNRVTR